MTPSTPLRVAAAQAASVSGDVPTNVTTAVSLVESATKGGAEVVVLPELFLTGYDPASWGRSAEAVVTVDDGRLRPISDAARTCSAVVVAGAAVRRGGGPRQRSTPGVSTGSVTVSLLVFDSAGDVSAPYDKQHLFDAEREFFDSGDHGASIVVHGWELGLGICYDGCFPEHAAAAAADGAMAYLCPSAYYRGSEHRRDLYYAARALDNGIYVVFSGLTGRCGDYDFNGGSAIYDPEGRQVDRVADESPAVAFADLDPEEVGRAQKLNPIGRDRLADLGSRHHQVLSH